MKCLFLGYNRDKTKLIRIIEKKGIKVKNISRKLKQSDLDNYDFYISFGYRNIISEKLLNKAKRPIINLHMSYLPYNRGAHPNFWSFVNNTPSGVSIHEIDKGIDTGAIIFQKKIKFNLKKNKNLTFKNTHSVLHKEAELLFIKNLEKIINNQYKKRNQKKIKSFHRKKDLPKNLKSWNTNILAFQAIKR